MEREAVLHWLQDVQAATHNREEFDEGFLSPDKSNHSGRYLQDSSRTPCAQQPTKQTYDNPQQLVTGTGQFSIAPITPSPLTPSAPQVPTATTRRAAFKLTKSITLCGGDNNGSSGMHLKRSLLARKAPSFDVPEHNGKLRQSSVSPLPSSNPDFVLPTIHLPLSDLVAPERKPLMQESSTAFLSKLMTKTPQQYLLQSSSFLSSDLPEHVKSPHWQRRAKVSNQSRIQGAVSSYSHWDMSRIGNDVPEPVTDGAMSDGAGSCVAEQGELSDVASSGGMEEEGGAGDTSDGGEVGATHAKFPSAVAVDIRTDVAAVMAEDILLWGRMERAGMDVSMQHQDKFLVQKISQQKSASGVEPSLQQGAGEVTLSPFLSSRTEQSEVKQQSSSLAELLRVGSGADYSATGVSSEGSPLQGSSPSKHIRSLSDSGDHMSLQGLPSQTPTPSLGHDSLTFHDHHLGRMATRGLVRSPTLDEGSKISAAMGPTYGHWNKLCGHSPLLGRTEASKTAGNRNVQCQLSEREKKWKPAVVDLLSKPTPNH